ncbi:hypothetical protein VDG1235_4398 [Verrucomicrobiia bacterium DG1235]|nr:hypothetical protein VDG1235_4398 [Verrucomicrobiae bacterium DG1235]
MITLSSVRAFQFSEPTIRILQSIALPAAVLGAPRAISGASQSEYTVEPGNPALAQVGETIVIGFSINIAPQSWTISGDIPPGLRLTDLRLRLDPVDNILATHYGVITGTPTQAGTYQLTLTPWGNEDGTGDTAPTPLRLDIVISPSDTPPPNAPDLRFSQQNQTLSLSWEDLPQNPYQLQVSSDLETWSPSTQVPTTSGSKPSIRISITEAENSFYRLAPVDSSE